MCSLRPTRDPQPAHHNPTCPDEQISGPASGRLAPTHTDHYIISHPPSLVNPTIRCISVLVR